MKFNKGDRVRIKSTYTGSKFMAGKLVEVIDDSNNIGTMVKSLIKGDNWKRQIKNDDLVFVCEARDVDTDGDTEYIIEVYEVHSSKYAVKANSLSEAIEKHRNGTSSIYDDGEVSTFIETDEERGFLCGIRSIESPEGYFMWDNLEEMEELKGL